MLEQYQFTKFISEEHMGWTLIQEQGFMKILSSTVNSYIVQQNSHIFLIAHEQSLSCVLIFQHLLIVIFYIPNLMAQIVPSRMNLQLYKQKIIAAKKGHELLKRKADALKAKFRKIMDSLLKSKKKMGEECQQALFLFAEAKYAAGDFQNNVKESVKRACIRLDKTEENIAGVLLPNLTVRELEDNENSMSQIGMERGGQSIQKCRDKFKEVLTLLVEIASYQASFVTLDEKIKVTNRRVNALEHVVIPKFQSIYAYIDQELDEQAKEDFYRLKKVLDNKRRLVQEEEEAKKKLMATTDIDEDEKTQNLLEEFDEDIIF